MTRKYGTLELMRNEIRGLIKTSLKLDPITVRAQGFREGLNAALLAIDRMEEEEWCLLDLDADQESFDVNT